MTNLYVGFDKRECGTCSGNGVKLDPTNADKVNPGPNPGQCAGCKGEGHTFHGILRPDLQEAQDRERRRLQEALSSEVGEMPAWMC